MLELISNTSNVGYLFLNDVTNGAVIQDPVVQRLSTKPGVKYYFNRGFFFSCSNAFSWIILDLYYF